MATAKDLTFRMDRAGDVIISQRGEHVCNVVQMLFNTVPRMDAYNTDMGLKIGTKKHNAHVNGVRDTAYETRIVNQFTTYTDLVPVQVLVTYKDDRMIIYLRVKYMDTIYNIDIAEDADSLTAVLRNS